MSHTESNSTSKRNALKISKKIKRALSRSDSFLTFYKLKKLSLSSSIFLDTQTTSKLFHFIKTFKDHNIIYDNDFDQFMVNFLLTLESENLELHLMCLGRLEIVNFDLIREKFSYSKIFGLFKSKIKSLFTDGVDTFTLNFLVKLLDNSKLVYKQLLPVIERLNIFLEKAIVDKSIVECCMTISSLGNGCFEVLNDTFVYSLLAYLVEFLSKPKNFFFIDLRAAQIITDTIDSLSKVLLKYEKFTVNIKKLSSNLLDECIKKIREYKKSTVFEEAMVVLCMTSCLTPLLQVSLTKGNYSIESIESDLLSFVVFEKNRSKTAFGSQLEGKVAINFDRPFKNYHNSQNQAVRDLFLMKKYTFIDTFGTFNRIEFLNDLLKVDNPKLIFSVMKNLKKYLDWTDLIVFACNAPRKDGYISLIFDDAFTSNSEHFVFVDIFLNSVVNNSKILVYCTKCAICCNLVKLLPRLYLLELNRNTETAKKRRMMIIEYLNRRGDNIKYGPQTSEEVKARRVKEVKVNIEKITLSDDTVERHKTISVNEVIPAETKMELDQSIDFDFESVEIDISIQEFVSILARDITELHANLVPLLIVLASKRIEKNCLEELLSKIIDCLKRENRNAFESDTTSLITISAILCIIYKNEYYTDKPLNSVLDLILAEISIITCEMTKEYIARVKKNGFDIILLEPKYVNLLAEIYRGDKESQYILEYSKMMWLLTGKKYFYENLKKSSK